MGQGLVRLVGLFDTTLPAEIQALADDFAVERLVIKQRFGDTRPGLPLFRLEPGLDGFADYPGALGQVRVVAQQGTTEQQHGILAIGFGEVRDVFQGLATRRTGQAGPECAQGPGQLRNRSFAAIITVGDASTLAGENGDVRAGQAVQQALQNGHGNPMLRRLGKGAGQGRMGHHQQAVLMSQGLGGFQARHHRANQKSGQLSQGHVAGLAGKHLSGSGHMRKIETVTSGFLIGAGDSIGNRIHMPLEILDSGMDQILVVFKDIPTTQCKLVGDVGEPLQGRPPGFYHGGEQRTAENAGEFTNTFNAAGRPADGISQGIGNGDFRQAQLIVE